MGNNLIIYNGKIHTINKEEKVVSCAVVEDGKYTYVGDEFEEISKKYSDFQKLDLNGRTVLPAFLDPHMHMRAYAGNYFGVNLNGYNDIEKYKGVLRDYLDSHPDCKFIGGSGWSDVLIPVTGPRKEDLDEVSTEIPIALYADTFHSLWVNSKALELAGINKDTEEIENGIIQRDEDGTPSGTVREDWTSIVLASIPDYSVEQYKEAFRDCAKMYNQLGVVGILDAWLKPNTNAVQAFKELSEEDYSLYTRGTYTMTPTDENKSVATLAENRLIDNVNERFMINTIKIFQDGGFEGRTGYLLEPYNNNDEDDPEYVSSAVWSQEELKKVMVDGMKHEFQIHVHCIGDAATKETLDAFEYAIKEKGSKTFRNIITHLELVEKEDYRRFKELGIIALLNPYWAEVDDPYYANIDSIGKERADRAYPINSLLQEGIMCAAASDFPVTDIPNPFNSIELGVTRAVSKYYHPWAKDYGSEKYNRSLGEENEKASIDDMVRMSTYNAAYTMFMEDITGSVEVGKNADFILLDQDIYSIDPSELTNTKIQSTYMKGEPVFERIKE